MNKEVVLDVERVHVELEVSDGQRSVVLVDVLAADVVCHVSQQLLVLRVRQCLRLCEFVVEGVLSG